MCFNQRPHAATRPSRRRLLGDLAIALGFVCAGASAQGGMDGSWTGRAETSIGGGRCGQSFGLQATIAGGELAGESPRP